MVEITVIKPFTFDLYKGSTDIPIKRKITINHRHIERICEDYANGHRIYMKDGTQYIVDTPSLKRIQRICRRYPI